MSALLWACAVCGAGQGKVESEAAYVNMSILLSLLPLAMMGGIVVWLYRSAKAADARAEASRQSVK